MKAINKAPIAPTAADSVGVAIPKKIDPKTEKIKAMGGNISINKFLKILDLFLFKPITGKSFGLIFDKN